MDAAAVGIIKHTSLPRADVVGRQSVCAMGLRQGLSVAVLPKPRVCLDKAILPAFVIRSAGQVVVRGCLCHSSPAFA